MYHTPSYLRVLADILPTSELVILAAKRNGSVIATMATFVHAAEAGVVLNALPYFGSHGDILLADTADAELAAAAIADALQDLRIERNIGALNIVAHPLAPVFGRVAERLGLIPWATRIGQISHLPVGRDRASVLDGVLGACNQKTRNQLRKGLRQGFRIGPSTADADWHLLQVHHQIGMERIGGRAKSVLEFNAIRRNLEGNGGCRLYVARRGDEFAGALLNLYHRDWVEYFTPVAVAEFRSEQVLSALIAHAMCDAAMAGGRHWNWGGTWLSQDGVHHFKSGWGAHEHIYHYFGAVTDPRLAAMSPQELNSAFPYYFVRPY